MKRQARNQTTCPVTFTANIIGDPWSLLIARDIVFHGKRTYSEFLSSGEYITTSMLADKLAHLENEGLLVRQADNDDKRKALYSLTDKGLDLFIPILVEIANWGVIHNPRTIPNSAWVKQARANKSKLVALVRQAITEGSSVFKGERSVISRLEHSSDNVIDKTPDNASSGYHETLTSPRG